MSHSPIVELYSICSTCALTQSDPTLVNEDSSEGLGAVVVSSLTNTALRPGDRLLAINESSVHSPSCVGCLLKLVCMCRHALLLRVFPPSLQPGPVCRCVCCVISPTWCYLTAKSLRVDHLSEAHWCRCRYSFVHEVSGLQIIVILRLFSCNNILVCLIRRPVDAGTLPPVSEGSVVIEPLSDDPKYKSSIVLTMSFKPMGVIFRVR